MSRLVEGLALLLAERGHGVYRVGAPYQPDDIAIVCTDLIPDPDRLVCVRVVAGGPEPDMRHPWAEPRVQIRVRGTDDQRDSAGRAAAILADLHGTGALRLPNGVVCSSIIATLPEPTPMGRDSAGRHEHTLTVRVDHRTR